MQGWLNILWTEELPLAPFRTNQTLGFFALVLAFVGFGKTQLQRGTSALLLASLPAFITFSRSSLSDLSGALLVATAFVFFERALSERRLAAALWGCIALGLACDVRLQLVFFFPVIFTTAQCGKPTVGRRLLNASCGGLVFLAAVSPNLLLNNALFGSPFSTGYHFWIPDYTTRDFTFGLQYVPGQLEMISREVLPGYDTFRAANIFGTGCHFTAPFLILSLIGAADGLRRKRALPLVLGVLSFLFGTSTYFFYNDSRLYFPLLLLASWPAALPISSAFSRLIRRKGRLPAHVLILTLGVFSVVGVPSLSGWPPHYSWSQLYDFAHVENLGQSSPEFIACKAAATIAAGNPVLVLSDLNPAYLATFLPPKSLCAPIRNRHPYSLGKWHFGTLERLALVRLAQEAGIRVLAISPAGTDPKGFEERLASAAQTTWQSVPLPSENHPAIAYELPPNSIP